MLIEYRKDYEKIAMGLLSYLPDFKNLHNLREEIKLNESNNDFELYLFRNSESNIIAVLGTQNDGDFIIIRYLSLAPGFREEKYEGKILHELKDNNPKKRITSTPECTYLLKYLGK